MATIMETIVEYLHEKGVGTETHPDGTLEVHTQPGADQLYIHIRKSGPYRYLATMWRGHEWHTRPFWTEVGEANWQWVHDELISICAEIIGDWETYRDINGGYTHMPAMPKTYGKEQQLHEKMGI
jgi:hypothetical protein